MMTVGVSGPWGRVRIFLLAYVPLSRDSRHRSLSFSFPSVAYLYAYNTHLSWVLPFTFSATIRPGS